MRHNNLCMKEREISVLVEQCMYQEVVLPYLPVFKAALEGLTIHMERSHPVHTKGMCTYHNAASYTEPVQQCPPTHTHTHTLFFLPQVGSCKVVPSLWKLRDIRAVTTTHCDTMSRQIRFSHPAPG